MEKKYLNRLGAFRKRKTFLEDPDNKPIWNGNSPARFTALAAEVYPLIDDLGALGADQSVGPSPIAAQQNSAEEDLEADAIILSAAISEYYKDQDMIADSQQWDIPDTGWTRAREQRLLDQAKLLRSKLTPLTVGAPAPGEPYGITAARVATYSDLVDAFEAEIGKPGARRGERKGETMSIPDRCRIIQGKFRSMEKLVTQFGGTPAGDLFVQGFLNTGNIDDLPGVQHEEPTPPNP